MGTVEQDSDICKFDVSGISNSWTYVVYHKHKGRSSVTVKAAEKGKVIPALWKGFQMYLVNSGELLKNCTEGSDIDMITYPSYKDYSGFRIELGLDGITLEWKTS